MMQLSQAALFKQQTMTSKNTPLQPAFFNKNLLNNLTTDTLQFSGENTGKGKTSSHKKKKLAGLLAVLGLLGTACAATHTEDFGQVNLGDRAASCVETYVSKAAEAIKNNLPSNTEIHCATNFKNHDGGYSGYGFSENNYSLPMPSQMDETELREMVGNDIADQLLSEDIDDLLLPPGSTTHPSAEIIETD